MTTTAFTIEQNDATTYVIHNEVTGLESATVTIVTLGDYLYATYFTTQGKVFKTTFKAPLTSHNLQSEVLAIFLSRRQDLLDTISDLQVLVEALDEGIQHLALVEDMSVPIATLSNERLSLIDKIRVARKELTALN